VTAGPFSTGCDFIGVSTGFSGCWLLLVPKRGIFTALQLVQNIKPYTMKTLLLSTLLLWSAISWTQQTKIIYETPDLRIEQVTANSYIHVSNLNTTSGKFACNGMVLVNDGEAMVLDTPVSDSLSVLLIQWIETQLKCRVKGVVVHHFHEDCLGGLAAFHERHIPSFASQMTIDLAWEKGLVLPQFEFESDMELSLGENKIQLFYLGAGHTDDNIVSYFPQDKLLFGGCLIKSMGANKGNVADADPNHWAKSVARVRKQFDAAAIVIPGHGTKGGTELLDYTIQLFRS